MPRPRRLGWSAATVGGLLLCGCSGGEDPRTIERFEEVFAEARSVILEEPAELPLGGIAAFAVEADGGWIVADAQEVRVHDVEGRFLRRFGRRGGGPAEFGSILDVATGPDRVWVADATRDHVGVHDTSGGEVGRVALSGGIATQIDLAGDRLVLGTSSRTEPRFTVLHAASGQPLARFLVEDSALIAVPYWGSLLSYPGVVHAGAVVAGPSLRYPLLRFSLDGDSLGTFGSPPASWRQAREPALGEFAGPRQLELLGEYVETFTMIVRLDALSDSTLLVTHGRFAMTDRPGPPARQVQTTIDVYDSRGSRRFEDLVLPGRVLGAARDTLYILLSEPPEGWRIGAYTLRR